MILSLKQAKASKVVHVTYTTEFFKTSEVIQYYKGFLVPQKNKSQYFWK